MSILLPSLNQVVELSPSDWKAILENYDFRELLNQYQGIDIIKSLVYKLVDILADTAENAEHFD